MEPEQIINTFLNWLNEKPSIFISAWRDLPELETQIAESADDELFPIAMTISKWCAKHELGKTLRDAIEAQNFVDNVSDARQDIRPRKPTPTTGRPTTNITKILRDSILTAYNQQQNPKQENSSDTDNEPK